MQKYINITVKKAPVLDKKGIKRSKYTGRLLLGVAIKILIELGKRGLIKLFTRNKNVQRYNVLYWHPVTL